jgi:REP element-mobilizing transposase RayT
MPGWDYSRNGIYFITMVTNNRVCWFGEINNDEMVFSEFGKIAETEWYKSFEIRQELLLDEFILMPNHLHALIILKKTDDSFDDSNDGLHDDDGLHNDAGLCDNDGLDGGLDGGLDVETHGRASLQSKPSNQSNQSKNQPIFQRKPKSISSFIAGYKSATINKIDDFIDLHHLDIEKFNRKNRLWQINYHDHIVRNDGEYCRIKDYIKNNPKN